MAQQKRSIIDHTFNCPHCGHRCLPENIAKHIQTQHPGLAEEDQIAHKMITPGLNKCPYCPKLLSMNQLIEHINSEHPESRWMAEERVKEKERERARKK